MVVVVLVVLVVAVAAIWGSMLGGDLSMLSMCTVAVVLGLLSTGLRRFMGSAVGCSSMAGAVDSVRVGGILCVVLALLSTGMRVISSVGGCSSTAAVDNG